MKLSRTVSYAVQAALQLAQSSSKDPVPCSRIAAEGKMPERFLLQILRSLVNHGILHSTRGVDGGYSLERTPDHVTLLEVIEAIDGPIATVIPAQEGLSEGTRDRLKLALDGVTDSVRDQLNSVKLSQLMAKSPETGAPKMVDSPESPLAPHFHKDSPSGTTPRPPREKTNNKP